ncbi:MAG TPA: hypothetical protein VJM12_18125 [Pyrinomonadaceae bacterium]|nr:hypothetical protein [Pyrinomonadaceae bacterium]
MNDSNQNISGDFRDDTVRRFLLGQLNANEQSAFEQGLFLDSELEARVRLAEFDLADDYACSRLPAADREQFEKTFLVSEDRKLKLNVSNALRDRFAISRARSRTTTKVVKQLFDFDRLAVRIAFSVAMLVVIVGGAWLVIKKREPIKETISKVTKIRRPQPSNSPTHSHHAQNASPRQTSSPMVVTLSPYVLIESGNAPTVNLPVGAHDIVRLELVVKAEPSASYQAQLSTIDGQTVVTTKTWDATEVSGEKIDLDVPVALLKSGEYRVTLTKVSDTSQENVATYYFRVAAGAKGLSHR